MQLIGDIGGTSSQWRLLHVEGIRQFKTSGFNAFLHSSEEFVKEVADTLQDIQPSEIHLYVAGAHSAEQQQSLEKDFKKVLGVAPLVANDLLGAARAVCGVDKGYVAILGTGANACFYDGIGMHDLVPSLGYLLGDEGSGAYLGKELLRRVYRSQLSQEVTSSFNSSFNLTWQQVLEQLYANSRPNSYLASFVPFIRQHLNDPTVHEWVAASFRLFFQTFLKDADHTYPMHFVGSVAYHFSDMLRAVGSESGFAIGTICASPIAGLALYHSDETARKM